MFASWLRLASPGWACTRLVFGQPEPDKVPAVAEKRLSLGNQGAFFDRGGNGGG